MNRTIFMAPFIFCAIILAGCAKNSGEDYTAFYPECKQPILEMQSRGSVAGGAVKGGVGGGLIGGVTGFFVGLLVNGGNVADAGISAAVGAATGAISGGISGGVAASHGPGTARDNQLLAQYYSQIDGDISGMDLREAAGTVALQCYRKKFAEVEEQEASGRLAAAAAAKRKFEIEQGMAEARALIGPEKAAGAEAPYPAPDAGPAAKSMP